MDIHPKPNYEYPLGTPYMKQKLSYMYCEASLCQYIAFEVQVQYVTFYTSYLLNMDSKTPPM